MPSAFAKTDKQHEAIALLKSDAHHVMLYGGGRSGKTFILLYAMVVRALKTKSRHLILRLFFNHVKTSVWLDTLPKVLELACPEIDVEWNHSDHFISFSNGSEIWIGGLDKKERTEKVLGTEYSTIFFNECSQLDYDSITTALSRLAERSGLVNRAYYDCNPPDIQHWAYRVFLEGVQPKSREPLPNPDSYVSMLINPIDNLANISPEYIAMLEGFPRRKRERFLLGLWGESIEGALWQIDLLDELRVVEAPELYRTVISWDPATTSKKTSDDHGIIVCSTGVPYYRDGEGKRIAGEDDKHGYVTEDLTGRYTPDQAAEVVIEAYHRIGADRVVAETNQGGDMIETILRMKDSTISYEGISASDSKKGRAEPVSALYDQRRIHHVGNYPEMEAELCTWTGPPMPSPNRLDSIVHGFAYLFDLAKKGRKKVSVF